VGRVLYFAKNWGIFWRTVLVFWGDICFLRIFGRESFFGVAGCFWVGEGFLINGYFC
jgi:hypothetical protein